MKTVAARSVNKDVKPSLYSHPEGAPRRFRMRKDRIPAPIEQVLIKGMTAVSPDSCLFPCIEKC